LAQKYKGEYQKPLTQKERGQLKMLANKIGAQTAEVIEFAIKNWTNFGYKASVEAGFGDYPSRPHIGFLLAHHHAAINLMHSIAAKPKPVVPLPPPSDVPKEPVDCYETPKVQIKALNTDSSAAGEPSPHIKSDGAGNRNEPFTEREIHTLLAELEEIKRLRYPEKFEALQEVSDFPGIAPLPDYQIG
jgi:hypothetical protein